MRSVWRVKPIKIIHRTKEGRPIDKLQVSHSSLNLVFKQFRFTICIAIDTASYIIVGIQMDEESIPRFFFYSILK